MVESVLSKIPLTEDLNENETVLKFAFNIYAQTPAKVEPYI